MINANRSHVCLRSTFCKATFYLATCIVLYMYCDKRPHYHTGGLVVQWLGSPGVRASDLCLNGHEFDALPLHYWLVGTWMGDHLDV